MNKRKVIKLMQKSRKEYIENTGNFCYEYILSYNLFWIMQDNEYQGHKIHYSKSIRNNQIIVSNYNNIKNMIEFNNYGVVYEQD